MLLRFLKNKQTKNKIKQVVRKTLSKAIPTGTGTPAWDFTVGGEEGLNVEYNVGTWELTAREVVLSVMENH